MLNRQIQDTNQISSAFESSVRGAAYIYSQRARPPVAPSNGQSGSKKDVLVTNPLLPQKSNPQIASTTANEAIKLALKKLSERNLNGNADYNRVSQLAQQLAKVDCGCGDHISSVKSIFSSIKMRKRLPSPDRLRPLFSVIIAIPRRKFKT